MRPKGSRAWQLQGIYNSPAAVDGPENTAKAQGLETLRSRL